MTTPISESHPPTAREPKVESFVDWFHINSRLIAVGAVLMAIAIFGVWFVQRTRLNEQINSDKQLLTAKQTLNTGNVPLAESDLKKVMDKYSSKPAGAEAGILLAQVRMERGDYAAAATGLQELTSKVTDGPNAAQARALLGDALAQQGKTAEAAAEYEKAAGLTTMTNEKTYLLARAARTYGSAGRGADARRLWEPLASQAENDAVATEARVRMGELSMGGKP